MGLGQRAKPSRSVSPADAGEGAWVGRVALDDRARGARCACHRRIRPPADRDPCRYRHRQPLIQKPSPRSNPPGSLCTFRPELTSPRQHCTIHACNLHVPTEKPNTMRTQRKTALSRNRQARFAFCADVQVTPWEGRASAIVSRFARAGRVFSSDDVWARLARAGVSVPVAERRALGNVIRAAQRHRVIRSAGIRKSARATRQGGYVTVWVAA